MKGVQVNRRLAAPPASRRAVWVRRVRAVPRLLGLVLIRAYQLLLSPLLPPGVCRFYPSCSQYAYLAVARHGLIWGSWLALRRLLRCHPWNPGGVDDVPEHGWRRQPHQCRPPSPTEQAQIPPTSSAAA